MHHSVGLGRTRNEVDTFYGLNPESPQTILCQIAALSVTLISMRKGKKSQIELVVGLVPMPLQLGCCVEILRKVVGRDEILVC